jgi:hypothetical protein
MLGLLYQQVERTREQMESSGFSSDLYEPAFETIYARINPGTLFIQWGDHREHIRNTLHTLKFCSEALPDEEELIGKDALESIKTGLDDLEISLEVSVLSDDAKSFIRHHIALIRKAIRDYEIVGVEAFRTATYEGYADYVRNLDTVLEIHDKEEFTLLEKTWLRVKKSADLTVKAEKLLTAGTKLYEMGDKAADYIERLLKSGS